MENHYLPGDFRQRLRELMSEENATRELVAGALGISPSKLSRFLRRETESFEPELIVDLARIFNVSTDFLLGVTNDKQPVDYKLLKDLGLSGLTIRKLISGEVDAGVINQLLESDSAGELTNGIRAQQDIPARNAINTAANLASQIIASTEADGRISAEQKPAINHMKQSAKLCTSNQNDMFLERKRIMTLWSKTVNRLMDDCVYCVDSDAEYIREALNCKTSEVTDEIYTNPGRIQQVKSLIYLLISICEVLNAPRYVIHPLIEAASKIE